MDQAFVESISDEVGAELAAAGQKKVPIVTCTVENVLSPEDVARYVERAGSLPATKSDEKDVQVLRAKHHQIARLLATGIPEGIVAGLVGYSASYVSTLKNSPSMLELIAHYRLPNDQAAKIIAEKLRFMADLSLEQLIEKLQAREIEDVNQLLAAVKLGADRSGNGPLQKVAVDHHHSLDEETVQRIAETARNRNKERIIDIHAIRQALPSPTAEPRDADA